MEPPVSIRPAPSLRRRDLLQHAEQQDLRRAAQRRQLLAQQQQYDGIDRSDIADDPACSQETDQIAGRQCSRRHTSSAVFFTETEDPDSSPDEASFHGAPCPPCGPPPMSTRQPSVRMGRRVQASYDGSVAQSTWDGKIGTRRSPEINSIGPGSYRRSSTTASSYDEVTMLPPRPPCQPPPILQQPSVRAGRQLASRVSNDGATAAGGAEADVGSQVQQQPSLLRMSKDASSSSRDLNPQSSGWVGKAR